jgi:hypothetical protein
MTIDDKRGRPVIKNKVVYIIQHIRFARIRNAKEVSAYGYRKEEVKSYVGLSEKKHN